MFHENYAIDLMKKGSAAFQQHVYTADKEFCQEMQYI